MKKSTRTILLVAIFTLSFGIVLSTIGFFMGPNVFSKIWYDDLWNGSLIRLPADESSHEYDESNIYHVGASHIETLEIDWVSGNVKVIPYDGTEVKIKETSKGKITEDNAMQIRQRDGNLSISFSKKSFGINFGFGNFGGKSLEVKIPRELVEVSNLDFSSASSDLSVRGLDLVEMSTDTASGTIEIADTTVSGSIEASSVSGDLILDKVKTSELSMDSTSGKIRGNDVKSTDVTMGTVSGKLEVDFINCPSLLSMDSTSGDVIVSIPKGSGVTISTDSVSGNITTDFATKIVDEEYIIGDGQNIFELSTVSGDMRIKKN